MKKKTGLSFIISKPGAIDWELLIFLLFFLNVKLLIKAAAIFLMYVLRPDFRFGFRIKNPRLPLFYILIIGIGFCNWLLSGQINKVNYDLVLLTGIAFWAMSILAVHQVKLAIEVNDPAVIHRTIMVFFVLNAIVSLAVFAGIVWETGTINPYRYQGDFQKYFIGTGDYIKGITFDTSTTNAVLNAFGVIYFLMRDKNMPALLCMAVLLLTGSNITNLLLCLTLVFIFFFRSTKDQKSIIIVCLVMLTVFFVKISPQNNNYVAGAWYRIFNKNPKSGKELISPIPVTQRPESLLTADEKKEKIARLYMDSINISLYNKTQNKLLAFIRPAAGLNLTERPLIPGDSIHTAAFQHRDDTNRIEKKLKQFVEKIDPDTSISELTTKPKIPGKLIALQQTFRYFNQHPYKIITGTGIGNFSSKLAFRSTAMNISGSYPGKYAYINDDFESNHLKLYLFYFTGPEEKRSITNSPNNTYDQLLSEYGLAGLFVFAFFYTGFFIKQYKNVTYGIPILAFMLGIFFVDYWFEQLSIVIFFELLLFLNIKESKAY